MNPASGQPPPLPTPASSSSLTPALGKNRIEAIDVIRGVAICGLVPMNILDFGFAEDHYMTPGSSLAGPSLLLWHVIIIFGSGKFMSLFALLFGAGIILATQKKEAAGLPVKGYFTRRLGWLGAIGMLHAYLVWYGDILVAYAVTGFVLFWSRNWKAKSLTICGILMLAVLPVAILLIALGIQLSGTDLQAFLESQPEEDAFEQKANESFTGPYLEQLPYRALYAFLIQVFGIPFLIFWIAGGWMCLGMALTKIGFFQGRLPLARYRRLAASAIALGAALGFGTHLLSHLTEWNIMPLLYSFPVAYLSMIALALGYACLILYWCLRNTGAPTLLQQAFANVGRMALSNYIGQSLILSLIFYGHGLGLRSQLPFPLVIAVVPAVWIVQITLSSIWMKTFQFGPLEWLWRCLTYGKRFPIRSAAKNA